MDKLACMNAFRLVAQVGSFTKAAKRLGVSTKVASNHVAWLERELAVQLLNRTTRSVMLTDAGRTYLHQCEEVLDRLEEIEGTVRESHERLTGSLRIAAPYQLGAGHVANAIGVFLQRHPALRIDLQLSDRRRDLVTEGFDLSIRLGRLTESSFRARRLATTRMVLCAGPRYLAEKGTPALPQDLRHHACLVDNNLAQPGVWSFRDGIEQTVNGPFQCNGPGAIRSLALANAGIARLPCYTIIDDLAHNRLTPILTDHEGPGFDIHAIYPPTRFVSARLRELIDHLVDHFAGLDLSPT